MLRVVGVFEAVGEGSVDADVGEPDQGERGRQWGVLPQADRDHDHGHRCGVCGVVEQGADAVAGEEADRGEVREQERQRVSHQCSWVVV